MSNLKRQNSYFLTNVYWGRGRALLAPSVPAPHPAWRQLPAHVRPAEVLPEGRWGDMRGSSFQSCAQLPSSQMWGHGQDSRPLQPDGNQQNHTLSPPCNLDGSPDATREAGLPSNPSFLASFSVHCHTRPSASGPVTRYDQVTPRRTCQPVPNHSPSLSQKALNKHQAPEDF